MAHGQGWGREAEARRGENTAGKFPPGTAQNRVQHLERIASRWSSTGHGACGLCGHERGSPSTGCSGLGAAIHLLAVSRVPSTGFATSRAYLAPPSKAGISAAQLRALSGLGRGSFNTRFCPGTWRRIHVWLSGLSTNSPERAKCPWTYGRPPPWRNREPSKPQHEHFWRTWRLSSCSSRYCSVSAATGTPAITLNTLPSLDTTDESGRRTERSWPACNTFRFVPVQVSLSKHWRTNRCVQTVGESPRKRKATGPQTAAPPPSSAQRFRSPTFSHSGASLSNPPAGRKRGHSRQRSDLGSYRGAVRGRGDGYVPSPLDASKDSSEQQQQQHQPHSQHHQHQHGQGHTQSSQTQQAAPTVTRSAHSVSSLLSDHPQSPRPGQFSEGGRSSEDKARGGAVGGSSATRDRDNDWTLISSVFQPPNPGPKVLRWQWRAVPRTTSHRVGRLGGRVPLRYPDPTERTS